MKNTEEIIARIKELESLKLELLKVNADTANTMVTRLTVKIEELNWVLGLE